MTLNPEPGYQGLAKRETLTPGFHKRSVGAGTPVPSMNRRFKDGEA